MSEYAENGFAELPEALPAPTPRGWVWPAWIIIALFVAGSVFLRERGGDDGAGKAAPAGDDRLTLRLAELQYRTLVGAAQVFKEKKLEEVKVPLPPAVGPVTQRLYHIALAGDVTGAKEALAALDQLTEDLRNYQQSTTKEQDRLRDILRRLYQDYAKGRVDRPSLTEADARFLREQLGWFGELALAPALPPGAAVAPAAGAGLAAALSSDRYEVLAPAEHAFSVFAGAIGLLVLVGLAGLIGLIVFLAMAAGGKLLSRLDCGTGQGGIYAETFALWLILWVGLSLLAVALAGGQIDMWLAGGVTLLSLAALAWPVQRGIPWDTVRKDIGLTWGQGPISEVLAGLGCYILALPLMAAGLIIVLFLMYARSAGAEAVNPFQGPGTPSHPIIEPLAFGGWETRIAIVLLAAVVAPFVEEIMFRGVLYRHLREASCGWATVWSIIFSGTLTSFIFAVMHPQGLIAVPVLMMLAYGFTLAREWRGSLIPCMVAHGLSNGLVTLLFLAAVAE